MARHKSKVSPEVAVALEALTPADEWGAKEEVALFAMLTPALALSYTERFWARVCLSFSEQASVAAERMRFRAMDEHTTRFYAWDGAPGDSHDAVRGRFLDEAAWFGVWNGNGEHAKQQPRTWDLLSPLPTAVAGGVKQRLCVSWLRKDNGKTWGQSLRDPMHTITCKDTKRLMRLALGEESSPKVREWFAKWLPDAPPVVPVNGVDHPIADITERLLHPRELARGMGVPDSYILPDGVTEAVHFVGNGISIEPAASIVRLNVEPPEEWKPPKRRAS